MARFLKNRNASLGKAPGEPVFIGERKTDEVTMHVFDYTTESLHEYDPTTVEELAPFRSSKSVTWININGLHDAQVIHKIGELFEIHPMVIEDILFTGQRPKMEEYSKHLFTVIKMMSKNGKLVINEQLSFVLLEHVLITFQERPGDVFDATRDRIRTHQGRIRDKKTDYLMYALIDTVVDNYTTIIENMGEEIENIEDLIFENFDKSILSKINGYKREMNYMRKTLRPTSDFIRELSRTENPLIDQKTAPFLNDLLDQAIQTRDIVDTYRDMLADQLDIFNSEVNNRLNEIMKFLTIFSAVFIPLTFIAGIYGTNFEYLPELQYRYSYFIFLGVLVLIATGMIGIFKKMKWL